MKRIVYTAVALIFCASVFGIADYYNAEKQGTLVDYSDEAVSTKLETEKKSQAITTADKEVAAITKKELTKSSKPQKKQLKTKVKPQRFTDTDLEVTETKEPVSEKVEPVTVVLNSKGTDGGDSTVREEKRTIRAEMFSRAAIREPKTKKK